MDKKIIFWIVMLFILPGSIFADCNNALLSRYKSLASNISNYYEFDESTKKFNVVFYNVSGELSINNDSSKFLADGDGFINIGGLNPGQSLAFTVLSNESNCTYYKFKTIYVVLPYYNEYYNDPICSGSNNKLCYKWTNTSMYSYDQFKDKMTSSQKPSVPDKPVKEKLENKYGFFDFLADYYILILLMIIFSGSYGIYVLDKKSKFDF